VETAFELVGWAGAILLVLAYGLVSAGRLAAAALPFQLLNVAGGVALAANSGYHSAWPSAALNVVWVAVAVGALARARLATRSDVPIHGHVPSPGKMSPTGQ
jgi:hypothetical protein